ncbi:MAG: nitroreductase, partial [Clostridia bacterium]|nr:nitroreductase [Clostridia bacterium]
HKALNLDENTEIINVIALGKPAETAVIENIRKTDSIKYWRDDNGIFHVPKIIAEELIIKL